MIHQLFQLITDLLFPRRCPVCGEIVVPKGRLICPECLRTLSLVRPPVCKKCGKEVENETQEYCLDCTRQKRTFDYGIALFNYDQVSSRSMAAVKYHNKREYLDFYSEAVMSRYEGLLRRMNPDVLVPVPVHPSRKRRRGFNQAEVLAGQLSEKLGIPMAADMLVRNKNTLPQKQLGPAERLKNLQKAFGPGISGGGIESVLLVDDIYTTGSTIEACARVLKKMGVKRIYFIVLCIGRGR